MAAPAQPGWVQVKDRDCYVWDPLPVAGESVTWTGECEGGFATGIGKVHWFTATGATSTELEGKETAGKLEGEVTVTYPDGSRYVGNLDASGNTTGFGVFTYPTGLVDRGFFVGGRFVGQDRDNSEIKEIYQKGVEAWNGGHFKDAETLYEKEINLLSKQLGSAHLYIAYEEEQLAATYITDDQFDHVEKLLRSSIEIFDRYFGEDNIHDSEPLIYLGNLYSEQGHYSDAETYYQHALRTEQRNSNVDNMHIIACLNGLAAIYFVEARFHDSENCIDRLSTSQKKLSVLESNLAANISENIAAIYIEQGRYSEAESILTRALAITTKLKGENHFYTALILERLSELYRDTGNYSKAEAFSRRALSINERTFGEHNSSILADVRSLGRSIHLDGSLSGSGGLSEASFVYRQYGSQGIGGFG